MDPATARADLHCHSTASELSRLGVQRSMGLPECATPPEEVYELAKRRGMDFVTITDHDTIAGAMEIADRPDAFVSVELTAHFRDEPQAVHVLCLGITPDDHEWLQAHRGDVELCAAYMQEREITCALAHPYYTVAAPLGARHRRRLAELFAVWEVRNGARARELNGPAATYVATRDAIGVAGSDDHAGVDIGRTFTETAAAATPEEFLAHIRTGAARARGEQGSAAKWAHAAIALAARSLPGADGAGTVPSPDPARVLTMVRRLLREADARHGPAGGELTPADARCLLHAWLSAVGLDELDERALIAHMQSEEFDHADLYRRACRAHERKLRNAVAEAVRVVSGSGDLGGAAQGLFAACIAAVPYAPATAFLASERAKLAALPDLAGSDRGSARGDGERPRVAIVADGIGATHGVTRTIEEIRARGVPGYEIEVLGTDPAVDRRLGAVAEVEVPFYPGLHIGVPSLPAAVQALADGCYEAIHVCSPGPAGIAAALVARATAMPLVGSYHTELTAYAGLRSGALEIAAAMAAGVAALYGACDVVLSPSPASDTALAAIGTPSERVLRWDRGVDSERFGPELRDERLLRGELTVLYAGRITTEKGSELLVDGFLAARRADPRLHLALAGGGPEAERVLDRLGEHATELGWLHGEELARAYASADMLLFPSATDTFGQVILEAQASGLPVVAVARGGPCSLIEDRRSGLLCEPTADAIATALLELAGAPLLRRALAAGGLASARGRSWEQAMRRLAEGYDRALGVAGATGVRDAA
jgi:glycosyltransferase involved in cell wall biosynthesis/predicted metal-dependent phosphoesterase TrpH